MTTQPPNKSQPRAISAKNIAIDLNKSRIEEDVDFVELYAFTELQKELDALKARYDKDIKSLQAEGILVMDRCYKLQKERDELKVALEVLQAENERISQFSRQEVARLFDAQAEIADLTRMSDGQAKQYFQLLAKFNERESEVQSLQTKLEKAKAALEFYAEGMHLNGNDHDIVEFECEGSKMTDHLVGKLARETLADLNQADKGEG